ncbi:MAG: hypothetical protein Q8Q20_02640 [bacterium]|nr:hypothetical protein [bacterium]
MPRSSWKLGGVTLLAIGAAVVIVFGAAPEKNFEMQSIQRPEVAGIEIRVATVVMTVGGNTLLRQNFEIDDASTVLEALDVATGVAGIDYVVEEDASGKVLLRRIGNWVTEAGTGEWSIYVNSETSLASPDILTVHEGDIIEYRYE